MRWQRWGMVELEQKIVLLLALSEAPFPQIKGREKRGIRYESL